MTFICFEVFYYVVMGFVAVVVDCVQADEIAVGLVYGIPTGCETVGPEVSVTFGDGGLYFRIQKLDLDVVEICGGVIA